MAYREPFWPFKVGDYCRKNLDGQWIPCLPEVAQGRVAYIELKAAEIIYSILDITPRIEKVRVAR